MKKRLRWHWPGADVDLTWIYLPCGVGHYPNEVHLWATGNSVSCQHSWNFYSDYSYGQRLEFSWLSSIWKLFYAFSSLRSSRINVNWTWLLIRLTRLPLTDHGRSPSSAVNQPSWSHLDCLWWTIWNDLRRVVGARQRPTRHLWLSQSQTDGRFRLRFSKENNAI